MRVCCAQSLPGIGQLAIWRARQPPGDSHVNITYRTNIALDAEAVADVFRRSGIRRPVDDVARIGRMLANANLIITAWDVAPNGQETLVGIARCLTDFAYCCYLSDLAVDREFQRQGIGKQLVKRVQDAIGDETMLLLLAAPQAMDYYPYIGFNKVENAWMLPRKR